MRFDLAHDPWLSGIVGCPAYGISRVESKGVSAAQVVARLAEEGAFATAKVAADDVAQAVELAAAGLRIVDTALTFSCPVESSAPAVLGVREASGADAGLVRRIAASSFRYSRFHLDPGSPDHLANRIKEEWAGNFFRGVRGDAMLIADSSDGVAGFCQLLIRGDNAIIDLIAVDAMRARQGLGSALVRGVAHFVAVRHRSVMRILVGTQSANIPSVNLYESAGFRLNSSAFVIHYLPVNHVNHFQQGASQ